MEFSYEDIPRRPSKATKGMKVTKGKPEGWVEKSPLTNLTRRTAPGESGMARLIRLQQETPKCETCGAPSAIYRRTLNGKDVYRCRAHIGSTVENVDFDYRAISDYEDWQKDNQGEIVLNLDDTSTWVVCPKCLDALEGAPGDACSVCGAELLPTPLYSVT